MHKFREKKYKKHCGISLHILPYLFFILLSQAINAQYASPDDTTAVMSVLPVDINSIPLENADFKQTNNEIIPYKNTDKYNTGIYDTLKVITSKNLFTKTLYDLIVIPSKDMPKEKDSKKWSEHEFVEHENKIIREIDIRRLDVFGSTFSNYEHTHTGKFNNFLNNTHINTATSIIRNNLLFSEGEKVSALKLSDNERLLRDLPYINDSKIVIIPVSADTVDIMVLTKDVYSLGASIDYKSFNESTVNVFDNNFWGIGNEIRFSLPYNTNIPESPGFGIRYNANNLFKTFTNFSAYYIDSLGKDSYGIDMRRNFVGSSIKNAGGISIKKVITSDDLDTLSSPEPFKYIYQNYWLAHSIILNESPLKRITLGIRYTYNHVIDQPPIAPDSYHEMQNYKFLLGNISFSEQRYRKTNLLYAYGRTEDIPYGYLINLLIGRELGQFSHRKYLGGQCSFGHSLNRFGNIHSAFSIASYLKTDTIEQGLVSAKLNYFSDLYYLGNYRLRNFVKFEYTRGIKRFKDEYLKFKRKDGFSGFSNDSTKNIQRLTLRIESVLFSPRHIYGLRFAYFAYGDISFLWGAHQNPHEGYRLSSIGLGIRIRTDNLVFNTLQLRLCFFPTYPHNSSLRHLIFSGEQLLRPDHFEPGMPSIIPYK